MIYSANKRRSIASLLAALVFFLFIGADASATPTRVRSDAAPADLQRMWNKLDLARAYRCVAGGSNACAGGAGSTETGRCVRVDREDMLDAYEVASIDHDDDSSTGDLSPKDVFIEFSGSEGFSFYLADSSWGEEARWGLQETLNELMVGQLLLGNQDLLQGLAVRFPSNGNTGVDQTQMLRDAMDKFELGVRMAIPALVVTPDNLRARDFVVPIFPFWVENAAPPGAVDGEVVESEMHRLTELIARHGMASNALGRRIYFFGNVIVDGDTAARDEAVDVLKSSAHATYLNTALLAALQSEEEFRDNNGTELKREIVTAQKIFDDIVAGYNPLERIGGFVPRVACADCTRKEVVEAKLQEAVDALNEAITDEAAVDTINRDLDEQQTELASELAGQQTEFLDAIEALTGETGLEGLTDADERATFFETVEQNLEVCVADNSRCADFGELGKLVLAIIEKEIESRAAFEQLRSIPELIRIEEERFGATAVVTLANGAAQGAATMAIQTATACETGVSVGVSGSLLGGPEASVEASVTCNPGQIATAGIAGGKELWQAIADSAIEGIDSEAEIDKLLLQQAQAYIEVERAGVVIEAKRAELEGGRAELERAVRNYVTAQENLACAYYSNPAYRLAQTRAERAADEAFETGMRHAYEAAKVLEYEWAERLTNPIPCTDGTCDSIPIGPDPAYAAIVRAESVFASASANTVTPTLKTFLNALRAWNADLRDLRANPIQPETSIYSMRRDIFGFHSDGTPAQEELSRLRFRDFVAANRVPGEQGAVDLVFTFSTAERLNDLYNQKLLSLEFDLVSRPGFPLRGGIGEMDSKAWVSMEGIAILQSPFEFLRLELPVLPENLLNSRFSNRIGLSVDGHCFTETNCDADPTLANLSPSVSRWAFRIDMNLEGNKNNLILENLDDIRMIVEYDSGAPPLFVWPSF